VESGGVLANAEILCFRAALMDILRLPRDGRKNLWSSTPEREIMAPASYLRSRRSSISDADGRMGAALLELSTTGSRATNRALAGFHFAIGGTRNLMFHVSDIKDLEKHRPAARGAYYALSVQCGP